jgi:phosphate starvation-inducible PhoH-like protein
MKNSTTKKMNMLLTRLGENSKMVVIGDMDQSDLLCENGLEDITNIIDHNAMEYINYVDMSHEDVIRHDAVSEVLTLYKK